MDVSICKMHDIIYFIIIRFFFLALRVANLQVYFQIHKRIGRGFNIFLAASREAFSDSPPAAAAVRGSAEACDRTSVTRATKVADTRHEPFHRLAVEKRFTEFS